MHVVSKGSPKNLPSYRVHFLYQMGNFLVNHAVSHPVHVIEQGCDSDRHGTAVDGTQHSAMD